MLREIGLLVTCGTVSQSDLYGEELDVHEEPSRDATAASGQGKILVSYGESVMWSFAAEECQSWFVSIARCQSSMSRKTNTLRDLSLSFKFSGLKLLNSGGRTRSSPRKRGPESFNWLRILVLTSRSSYK